MHSTCMQVEHWIEARLLLEGVFVSGVRLHTRAGSRDPSSPCLETCPQHLLSPKQCAFTFKWMGGFQRGKGKQSKAGSLVKEIIQTKGLDWN